MTPEEEQLRNLDHNWRIRKDLAKRIGGDRGYDVCDYSDNQGRRIFYITRKTFPLGYVSCFNIPTGVQINSTFIRPTARRLGLGYMIYVAIISAVGVLRSDFDRTQAANALWEKLTKDPALDVQFEDYGSCSKIFTAKKK